MSEPRGATPAEWYHFDFELGLGSNLLPVVCDPNPTPAPDSKIKKWGKVPSAYNSANQAHGITKWQSKEILPNELQLWRADPRLGICVRTGLRSGVYAIDVDVDDQELADQIRHEIFFLGEGYRRTRANSPKFLVPIRLGGSTPKRIIETAHGRLELLGEGQQFLAAGTHPSGVRYEWTPGLPERIPALDETQFETLWDTLAGAFGKGGDANDRKASVSAFCNVVSGGRASGDNTLLTTVDEETAARITSALAHPRMLADGVENDFWSEVGYALLSLKQTGWNLFQDYSKAAPKYDPQATRDWWDSHSNQNPRTDYRHIFTLARARGWSAVASTDEFEPVASGADAAGRQGADPLDLERAPAPRPVVRLVDGDYPNITRQLTGIIANEVYKQSGALVRLGRPDELNDGIERIGDHRPLLRMSNSYMRLILGDAADFVRYDGRAQDWRRTDCPPDLALSLLTLGDWPSVRPLDAIARAPFVRADGTVCDMEGYDPASRVLYIPSGEFPPLPAVVTKEMAAEALKKLLGPFCEFPYALPCFESAFAAHVLTEAARTALRTAPMFWYTAPKQGSGKSLLAEMPGTIVHGLRPATRPWVKQDDELRKTLFASLAAGDRSIMFDNLPNGTKIRSPELCALLTSPTWKDRKLGASEMVEIPNRSVLSGSGNNITPVADMARRSLVVRLDVNGADRWSRKFRIKNLQAYVTAHRVDLLMAALTIIVGWQQNKTDDVSLPLPSFEDWSSIVRDPLMWLGLPDPVITQEKETDDESGSIEGAFEALGSYFAGREFTAASICNNCLAVSDPSDSVVQAMIAAGCQDPRSPTKVAYWLRDCRDKIGAGYKLLHLGRNKHSARWLLKPVYSNEDLV